MSEPIENALRAAARAEVPTAPPQPLVDALASRADEEGLVDVAYAQADSPFGPLTLAASERGLLTLAYPELELDDVLTRVAATVSPRVLELPARLDPVRRELDEYFAGRRTDFDFPLDRRLARGDFFKAVLSATERVPYGETVTYREIAARAGRATAVRAAGNGLGSNPLPVVVPCHRVVATGGGLGGYTGGLDRKRRLLALERGDAA